MILYRNYKLGYGNSAYSAGGSTNLINIDPSSRTLRNFSSSSPSSEDTIYIDGVNGSSFSVKVSNDEKILLELMMINPTKLGLEYLANTSARFLSDLVNL